MMILYEFIDLMEVIRIKMVAFDAEVPFDRFSNKLRFVGVGLNFDSFGLVSKLYELQNFSQLTSESTLSSSLACFCN